MNREEILLGIKSQLNSESVASANLANTLSFLYLDKDISWVGFYFVKENELVLSHFMGRPACNRIKIGEGVCGKAFAKGETIVVKNVHDFEGHIACDEKTMSEIVLPIIKDGYCYGVLDVDSYVEERFTEEDKKYFEEVVSLLVEHIDFDKVITKNYMAVMEERQSVRKYSDRKIPEHILEKIKLAGINSPSACNGQPYEVYLVTGEKAEEISKQRGILINKFMESVKSFIVVCEGKYNVSPVLNAKELAEKYGDIDLGICTANMVGAADAYGVDTCIIGSFKQDKVKEILKTEGMPKILIAMGMREENKIRNKKRIDVITLID